MTASGSSVEREVERAFGAENRQRILDRYFSDYPGTINPRDAWKHVYRLLLWINPTIGLAHCYESDKCQPGRPWYGRSLEFHAWVASQLGVPPLDLHEQLDYMFRAALPDLVHRETAQRMEAARKQMNVYPPGTMPQPGDDPELVEVVEQALDVDLSGRVETQRSLAGAVRAHLAVENKRKNLLGRGFEDALADVMRRSLSDEWTIRTRVGLREVPGFTAQGVDLERAEIDLAAWTASGERLVVSAKWSVRADRERQFESDFDDYVKANVGGPFQYVLVTNEFDAARLFSAATKVRGSAYLFDSVVHVSTVAVLRAYKSSIGADPPTTWHPASGRKARYLPALVAEDRITELSEFLARLGA